MSEIAPIGTIVRYVLSVGDAAEINRAYKNASEALNVYADKSGYQVHNGNVVSAGKELPAIVVGDWSDVTKNLKVFLDGVDDYWATSRQNLESLSFPATEDHPAGAPIGGYWYI